MERLETTIERILVGVDEGRLADGAIETGLRLAERLGARVELVHALDRPGSSWSQRIFAHAPEALPLDAIRDQCKERVRRLAPDGPQADVAVVEGKPADALLERAEKGGADLIVLGRHRDRGIADFGGTARAVLARSRCPVWVQLDGPRAVRRILVPLEGTDASVRVLDWARFLAGRLGARVTAYHCFRPPDFAYDPSMRVEGFPTYVVDDLRASEREAFEEFLSSYDWTGVEAESLFEEGRPASAILDRQRDFDLIVMGTHSRSRVARELLGSTAYGVLKGAEVPVVAVPLLDAHYRRT